jgi:hypothetical protein
MNDESLSDEMVRNLQRRTAQLPREIPPPADAWESLAARIDAERLSVTPLQRPGRAAFWQQPLFLAAAALTLVAASSIITSMVLSRSTRSAPLTATSMSTPGTLAQFTAVENDYIATTNRLSAALETGSELSPATIAKLRESLRIIDGAILEARRALAADPANRELMEMLKTSYGQKVDLLRRTTEMGQS